MHVFVTVGSTRFDALIHRVLSDDVLAALRTRGYSTLVVQCGNSDWDASSFIQEGDDWRHAADDMTIEVWRFKPSLQEEYERADLIISHAGSGTILDVLRLGKSLIVVPNETLLDNHQEELANALEDLGHLKASTISDLPQTIRTLEDTKLMPFPPFNGSRFRELLDEEMGFVAGPGDRG
ncbi:glycosyltransferase family 1 protein [Gelatoporia subvermispora B]|uniref:UDP-N-acetylglucosamine transferase subunit ALG13 n=1 Tax=Ceriporiopsis subvermispora (strain B) TaxID=914234 RepID=M2RHY3_CERS8|nr:glycosyltransferase family 1 protein [Gelatoporia subvermispora B]